MSTPEQQAPDHVTRIDETTWELHDEPPSAADAAGDRSAIRTITIYWILTGALFAWLIGAILPSFFGVPTFDPPVLGVGFVVLCATPLGVQLRWRSLRRRTGYPVTPSLHRLMGPASSVMADSKTLFNVRPDDLDLTEPAADEKRELGEGTAAEGASTRTGRSQADAGTLSTVERARAKRNERKRRRLLKQSTNRIVLRLEQAAAAERWGWTWWSHRCFNKIHEQVEPYANMLISISDESGDDEGATQEGAASAADGADSPAADGR